MGFLRKLKRASDSFLIRNGARIAVIRPADPEKAKATAIEIEEGSRTGRLTKEEAHEQFNEMIWNQPYTFVGYLSRKQKLLDHEGKHIGNLKPGDSFVNADQLEANQRAATASVS